MKLKYLKLIIILFISHNIYADELKYKNLFIGWKSVEGAYGYAVEVKDDAGILIITNDVKTNSINIRLPEGDFLLRIGAKNRQLMVENWSDWQKIKISIKNPPPPPDKIIADKNVFRNLINIRLAWDPPQDSEKKAVSYSILKLVDNNYKKIAETKDTEYIFTDLERGKIYKFMVLSVNKDGEESLKGLEITVDDRFIPLAVFIKANYIFPLMKFGDLFKYGYGSLLNIYIKDIFINNMSAGIESGYLYLKGKNSDNGHLKADNSYIIPVCLSLSYNIPVSGPFSIRPALSCGYTFNSMEYKDDYDKTQKKAFWDPAFSGGMDFLYKANDFTSFGIGTRYGILIESEGVLHFTSINAQADFFFNI